MAAWRIRVFYEGRCESLLFGDSACGHKRVLEVDHERPQFCFRSQSVILQHPPKVKQVEAVIVRAWKDYALEQRGQEVGAPSPQVVNYAVLQRSIELLLGDRAQRRDNELTMLCRRFLQRCVSRCVSLIGILSENSSTRWFCGAECGVPKRRVVSLGPKQALERIRLSWGAA